MPEESWHAAMVGKGKPHVGKVDRETNLAADPGAGHVLASEHARAENQAIADCELAAG
jgi:hypothetical protein